jgi:hypothetical protein
VWRIPCQQKKEKRRMKNNEHCWRKSQLCRWKFERWLSFQRGDRVEWTFQRELVMWPM